MDFGLRELPLQHQTAIKIGMGCNLWCQDRFAPVHYQNRLNATAAPPESGAQHRPPCISPRQRSCLFPAQSHRFGARVRNQTRTVSSKTEIVTMRRGWTGCAGLSRQAAQGSVSP